MLTMFNIPDGCSSKCLWGFYPHNKFPGESAARGDEADWDRCHNGWCMVYGAVSVHYNWNLSAFLKKCCQHNKMLDVYYQKNMIGRFKFNRFKFKKMEKKLNNNLKKGELECLLLREHRKMNWTRNFTLWLNSSIIQISDGKEAGFIFTYFLCKQCFWGHSSPLWSK